MGPSPSHSSLPFKYSHFPRNHDSGGKSKIQGIQIQYQPTFIDLQMPQPDNGLRGQIPCRTAYVYRQDAA